MPHVDVRGRAPRERTSHSDPRSAPLNRGASGSPTLPVRVRTVLSVLHEPRTQSVLLLREWTRPIRDETCATSRPELRGQARSEARVGANRGHPRLFAQNAKSLAAEIHSQQRRSRRREVSPRPPRTSKVRLRVRQPESSEVPREQRLSRRRGPTGRESAFERRRPCSLITRDLRQRRGAWSEQAHLVPCPLALAKPRQPSGP